MTRLAGDRLQLDATLRQGGPLATIGSPCAVTRDGETASVGVKSGDGADEIAVSFLPRVVSASSAALPPLPKLPAPPPPHALPPLPATPSTNALPSLPAVPR